MFKKILTSVLCLVIGLSFFTGCNLVTDNSEKNSLQVVATIEAVHAEGNDKHIVQNGYYEYKLSSAYLAKEEGRNAAYDQNTKFYEKNDDIFIKVGEEYRDVYDISLSDLVKSTTSWSFDSDKKSIYKHQLYSYINNYASEYMQQYNYTMKEVTEYFVDQLVAREIVLIEAEKAIAKGDIVVDNAFKNQVTKSVYDTIDSRYNTILDELLEERGIDIPQLEDDSSVTDPTYPLYPYDSVEESGEEELIVVSDEKYAAKWPGMTGSASVKSRELEAVRRLVASFEETVKDDFRMTKDERKRAEAEFVELNEIMKNDGIHKIYPELGNKFFINYLLTKPIEDDLKISKLQEFIAGEIEVSDDEVQKEYYRLLANQVESYTESIENLHGAADDKLVLYRPTASKHIYVKHILLQFSDEQKEMLEAYKKKPGTTKAGYIKYRDDLAAEIVGYEHINGEDDLDNPQSAAKIVSEIRATMAKASVDAKTAERTFDRLIYKYNQDPGIFGNALGYSMLRELGEGDTDTFVEEFAAGGRKFINEKNNNGTSKYKIGDILDYNVITDHGIHILYYSYERTEGTVKLNDYVTVGEYETYYDLLKETVKSAKTNKKFENWQNYTIYEYEEVNNSVTVFNKRFKDIYK